MNDISWAIIGAGRVALTGQQKYFVQVASEAHHQQLSVVSFEAIERIGEPYRITVQLTSSRALSRVDYLGRDATFKNASGYTSIQENHDLEAVEIRVKAPNQESTQ